MATSIFCDLLTLFLQIGLRCQLRRAFSYTLVFFHSGCHDKTPSSGWFINSRNCFVLALETGKARLKVLADSVSVEGLQHLPVSSHWVVGRGAISWLLLMQALIPFMSPSCIAWSLPKASPPNTYILQVRVQHVNGERCTLRL